MSTTALPESEDRIPAEHRFYLGLAIALLVTVLIGFARSFFLRPLFPDWPSPHEPVFYVHGALFTAWIVLLYVQVSLVTGGRKDLHRKLGPWGALLAAAMVVVGVYAALVAAGRPGGFVGVPLPPLQFLVVPAFDIGIFAAFVAIGVAHRRDPQAHKRWMTLATVGIITAAIARWPGVLALGPLAFFGLTDLFIVALGVWDVRSRGRLHPATLWGGLLLIASQPLRLVISGTESWLAFARWAIGLVP